MVAVARLACCSSARCAAARGAGSISASSTCSPRSSPRPRVALVLAKMLGESRRRALTNNDLIFAGVLTAVPLLLIARQPDLGTAVTLAADPAHRHLRRRACRCATSRSLALVAGAGGAGRLTSSALEDYQRERIATFLDPEQDARGAGYQQIQARITVGSGGVWARGSCRARRASCASCRSPTTTSSFRCSPRSRASPASSWRWGSTCS